MTHYAHPYTVEHTQHILQQAMEIISLSVVTSRQFVVYVDEPKGDYREAIVSRKNNCFVRTIVWKCH